jgi:hypothetical protein
MCTCFVALIYTVGVVGDACVEGGFVFHAGQLQIEADPAPTSMQVANARQQFVSVAATCCVPCSADPECAGFSFVYPDRCFFKRGPLVLGANLVTDAAVVGSQGGLYTVGNPPSPANDLGHFNTPSLSPLSPPPLRPNLRNYVSFGSVCAVLLFASALLVAVYLRRGVVLAQISVENVIQKTPKSDATHDDTSSSHTTTPASLALAPGLQVQAATVRVDLSNGWRPGLARSERKLLLG